MLQCEIDRVLLKIGVKLTHLKWALPNLITFSRKISNERHAQVLEKFNVSLWNILGKYVPLTKIDNNLYNLLLLILNVLYLEKRTIITLCFLYKLLVMIDCAMLSTTDLIPRIESRQNKLFCPASHTNVLRKFSVYDARL